MVKMVDGESSWAPQTIRRKENLPNLKLLWCFYPHELNSNCVCQHFPCFTTLSMKPYLCLPNAEIQVCQPTFSCLLKSRCTNFSCPMNSKCAYHSIFHFSNHYILKLCCAYLWWVRVKKFWNRSGMVSYL